MPLRRLSLAKLVAALAVVLGFYGVFPASSTPAGQPTAPNALTPLEHIVIIHKENRSFDHYFGKYPGANGATQGEMHDGTVIDLVPALDPMPVDPGHQNGDWIKAYNNGEMNGFDLETQAFTEEGYPVVYSQMDESQIPNYWAYARRYGLADNFFADYQGATFGNNLFRYAAQTGREDPTIGFRAVNSLPNGVTRQGRNRAGCDLTAAYTVTMEAPDGANSSAWPCYTFEALPNILSEFGVSWRTYGDPDHDSFTFVTLDAIAKVRYDQALWSNVVALEEFEIDAAAGALPAVSWVQPRLTDHPAMSSACEGENETVRLINAVMNGPDWSTTAIVITWDEWGGFYDHQVPPIVDNISHGFRVPVMVISPWVKYGAGSDGGYISSTFYSHGSPLKLIETNWGLPSLNSRDGSSNDMLDLFDFAQTPKDALILTERSCPHLTPEFLRINAALTMETLD
jgi:phospholipase C